MKKADIKVGGLYRAAVNGQVVTVRVDTVREREGYGGKTETVYDVTSQKTGRTTTFRSAAKFRSEVDANLKPAMKKVLLVPEKDPVEGDDSPDPTNLPVYVADGAVTDGTHRAAAARLAATVAPAAAPPTDTAPHIEVRALAGTGKSTTMVEGMAFVKDAGTTITPSDQQAAVWESLKVGRSDTIKFAAFGKAIATELQRKLAMRGLDRRGCEASTFHSMGFKAVQRAFGRLEPTEWAGRDIVCEVAGRDSRAAQTDKAFRPIVAAADRLVSLCKMNLIDGTDEAELDALAGHYDVEMDCPRAAVYDLVPRALARAKDPRGKVGFDDMVWLPTALGLAVPRADVIMVDEAQDLSKAQQALAYQAGHRIVMVGDRNQAIFGFAGGDAESMDRMTAEMTASPRGLTTQPLTVTRRCGKAIVEEARKYVPEFEAHESNPDGAVLTAAYGKVSGGPNLPWEKTYAAAVRPGDMVLCRINAPLVSQCFAFIRRGIKANILGRDVAKGLQNVLAKAEKAGAIGVVELTGWLDDWAAAEARKENAKRNPSQARLQAIDDRFQCLVCFTEGAQTLHDVRGKIESVFTDDREAPGVRFASVHRSKGLEADRVFWLRPKEAVLPQYKMKPWERVQERNLEYVAITRAISQLTIVA